MSNCCANSASVLSPRTAAKATFALKAGVWFRRGRFVMVSPVRHTSWPLSGRNSTYPAVQISKASSDATGSSQQRAFVEGDEAVHVISPIIQRQILAPGYTILGEVEEHGDD